jgi:PEGA domain-containing protein
VSVYLECWSWMLQHHPTIAPPFKPYHQTVPLLPGAAVVVNGIGRGRTPTRVQYLPLGSHTIRLVLAGYESQEQSVALTAARALRTVTLVLREITPGSSSPNP